MTDQAICNRFAQLAAINVGDHIEKKNGLSYLSWAWACDQLLRVDPSANWEYHEPIKCGKDTLMVSVTVTAFGKAMKMILPVMDYKNKAIPDPDSFAINTSYQRCLVKAIALHGLGLYIYAGEDLPLGDEPENPQPEKSRTITPTTGVWDSQSEEEQKFLLELAANASALVSEGRAADAVKYIDSQHLEADEKTALWTRFDSKERSAIKKAAKPTAEELATTP
jgi:hypothetical protein